MAFDRAARRRASACVPTLWLVLGLAGAAVTATGCSGPNEPSPQPPVVVPPPAPPPPPPPPPPNGAPVIGALTAAGIRPNEPPNLADVGEDIVVRAVVTDAETEVDRLTLEWSSPAGEFIGTGTTVRWRAPASVPSPVVVPLQLRVIDGDHRVEHTVQVRVHDHVREVGDLATLFLREFSDSAIPAAQVMRNFLPGCYGTEDERGDVDDNRRELRIVSWFVGPPRVSVDFDGVCPYERRAGDACSVSRVRWDSVSLLDGDTEHVSGEDQLAAVYRQDRWWLCDSKFDSDSSLQSGRLLELLTGRRRNR